jgi:hypothetical protein
MRMLADLFRWLLMLVLWSEVTYVLWGIGWGWALAWAFPGFFISLNIIGFATLPSYFKIGQNEAKRIRTLVEKLEEHEGDPPNSI